MRRLALGAAALAVAAAGAGARAECAHACTCAPVVAERALDAADAAFVGTLLERRVDRDEATLTFSVERRLKGPLGDRVTVVTAAQGVTCGISGDRGDRLGLFLERDGDAWRGGLCDQARADALAALPAAAGGDDVAGSFAEATAYVIALVALAAVGLFLLRRRFRPD